MAHYKDYELWSIYIQRTMGITKRLRSEIFSKRTHEREVKIEASGIKKQENERNVGL